MTNLESLVKKWGPVLANDNAPAIGDSHREAVVAQVLENTEAAIAQEAQAANFQMNEAAHANNTVGIQNTDPVLISLVRRAMPNLIAYDIASVQPMTGPTGLIFAMKSRYGGQAGDEVGFDGSGLGTEVDSAYSGTGTHGADSTSLGGTDTTPADTVNDAFGFGTGMSTAAGEALGDGVGADFAEMSFSIEKTSVTAKTRALKAEYTMEMAQDLKAIHGLNAESELASILSNEVIAEINREMVRTINSRAKLGAQQTGITTAGTFDLTTDADGRWSQERYKGLLVQIMREANKIAQDTRRGRGNFIMVSADVAAILSSTGMLDYTPALSGNAGISSDVTGATMVGTLAGGTGMKVYLDPYATVDYATIGYKGSNPYDAGIFYAPYVPLTMVRAMGENSFQPKIGFKTRYGMVANPFLDQTGEIGAVRSNTYYRIFAITNLLNQ
jgi:hypothetical protein